jgi:hypothetical protein
MYKLLVNGHIKMNIEIRIIYEKFETSNDDDLSDLLDDVSLDSDDEINYILENDVKFTKNTKLENEEPKSQKNTKPKSQWASHNICLYLDTNMISHDECEKQKIEFNCINF